MNLTKALNIEFYTRLVAVSRYAGLFDEADHPRDDDGMFTRKGSGSSGSRSAPSGPKKPSKKPAAEQGALFQGNAQGSLFDKAPKVGAMNSSPAAPKSKGVFDSGIGRAMQDAMDAHKAEPPSPPPSVKDPWEHDAWDYIIDRADEMNKADPDLSYSSAKARAKAEHLMSVGKALSEGKPVTASVLGSYDVTHGAFRTAYEKALARSLGEIQKSTLDVKESHALHPYLRRAMKPGSPIPYNDLRRKFGPIANEYEFDRAMESGASEGQWKISKSTATKPAMVTLTPTISGVDLDAEKSASPAIKPLAGQKSMFHLRDAILRELYRRGEISDVERYSQFVESEHPRANDGRFGNKTGEHGSAGSPAPEAAKSKSAHVTKSPAFKAWFGDWENDPASASKVVNAEGEPQETHSIPGTASRVTGANGKPVVVYHGTSQGGFDAFDESKIGKGLYFGPGFYFTENEEVAATYKDKGKPTRAKVSREEAMRIVADRFPSYAAIMQKDPTWIDSILRNADGGTLAHMDKQSPGLMDAITEDAAVREVKSCYLKIARPLDADNDQIPMSWVHSSWGDRTCTYHQMVDEDDGITTKDKLTKMLREKGYDGITHIGGGVYGNKDGPKHRVWIAFTPNQIKAADNRGTFDPNDNRINYALAAQFDREFYRELNSDPDGRWITIGGGEGGKGTHVKVKGGKIVTGPPAITGKKLDELPERGGNSDADAKEAAKPKPLPGWKEFQLKSEPVERPNPNKAKQKELGLKHGRRVGPGLEHVHDLHVDPERFQYKINVSGKKGVTGQFSDIKFNPEFAGTLHVWHDTENGKTYVVNGHHRHELAERSGYAGKLQVHYLDAANAEEARAKGALINIAGGNGTAVDAAKFMRDTGTTADELREHGVSLKGQVAKDAAVLSSLSPGIFRRLALGTYRMGRALAIAQHLPEHVDQDRLDHWIDRYEETKNRELSDSTVEEMAREAAQASRQQATTKGLFGEETEDRSLFVERAELKGALRRDITGRLNKFRAVATDKAAATLEGANKIDATANKQTADRLANFLDDFDRETSFKGPVSDRLNQASQELANAPGKRKQILERLNADIRAILETVPEAESDGAGSDDQGSGGAGESGGIEDAGRQYKPAAGQKGFFARQFDREFERAVYGRARLTEAFEREFYLAGFGAAGVARYSTFVEADHPRAADGRFGDKPGHESTSPPAKKTFEEMWKESQAVADKIHHDDLRRLHPNEPEELLSRFRTVSEFRAYLAKTRPPEPKPEVRPSPYPFDHVKPVATNETTKRWLDEWIKPADHDELQHASMVGGGARWVHGHTDAALDQIYHQTQEQLAAHGIKQVPAFRGIVVEEHTELAKAIRAGAISVGDEIDVEGLTFTSWSTNPRTAQFFASRGDQFGKAMLGLVFEQVVDAPDIVTGKNFHPGFEDVEDELIVKRKPGASQKVRIKEVLQ